MPPASITRQGRHAGPDRHQGHRPALIPNRPRSARDHHRRPPDRQSALAFDAIITKREGLSASKWPSGRSSRRVAKVVCRAQAARRMEHTIVVCAAPRKSAALQFLDVRRLRHGRGSHGERRHDRRAAGQRLSVRLGDDLSSAAWATERCVPAPPPARPEALPRRRTSISTASCFERAARGERREAAVR